jgi:hypothetical protein
MMLMSLAAAPCLQQHRQKQQQVRRRVSRSAIRIYDHYPVVAAEACCWHPLLFAHSSKPAWPDVLMLAPLCVHSTASLGI